MKYGLLLLATLALAGCETTAEPKPVNGNYYLTGDSNCKYTSQVGPTTILCYDAQQKATGYRNAMTPQDMAMWQMQQAQHNAQIARMSASLDQTNQAILNGARYPTMATPQVTPISPSGRTTVHCISASIYTNCRY